MSVEVLLSRLNKVKQTGDNQWTALCPAHNDKTPSLGVKLLPDGRILLHCFGCGDTQGVLDAIGLSLSDLFPEPMDKHIRPLYMAQQEKRQADSREDRIKSCELRLEMADEMRERGMPLTKKDLEAERKAFMELKRIKKTPA